MPGNVGTQHGKLLANDVDPGVTRRAQKAARGGTVSNTSSQVLCREWLDQRKGTVEPAQHVKTLARMENDVFPWLGAKATSEITAPDVLSVLRRIDETRCALHSASSAQRNQSGIPIRDRHRPC